MKGLPVPSLTLDVTNEHQHYLANSGLINSSVLNVFSHHPTLTIVTMIFLLIILILAMVMVSFLLAQARDHGRQLEEVRFRLCRGGFKGDRSQAQVPVQEC